MVQNANVYRPTASKCRNGPTGKLSQFSNPFLEFFPPSLFIINTCSGMVGLPTLFFITCVLVLARCRGWGDTITAVVETGTSNFGASWFFEARSSQIWPRLITEKYILQLNSHSRSAGKERTFPVANPSPTLRCKGEAERSSSPRVHAHTWCRTFSVAFLICSYDWSGFSHSVVGAWRQNGEVTIVGHGWARAIPKPHSWILSRQKRQPFFLLPFILSHFWPLFVLFHSLLQVPTLLFCALIWPTVKVSNIALTGSKTFTPMLVPIALQCLSEQRWHLVKFVSSLLSTSTFWRYFRRT